MKPTAEELQIALEEAERMRELGIDPMHFSKSLLYLNRRDEILEKLLVHVERYLQFGLPVDEHAQLTRLLDEIRHQERHESGGEGEVDLGLSSSS